MVELEPEVWVEVEAEVIVTEKLIDTIIGQQQAPRLSYGKAPHPGIWFTQVQWKVQRWHKF